MSGSIHKTYESGGFFDEMFLPDGSPRAHTAAVHAALTGLGQTDLLSYQKNAEDMLRTLGATFLVYQNNEGSEKILPFDVVPRVITASSFPV